MHYAQCFYFHSQPGGDPPVDKATILGKLYTRQSADDWINCMFASAEALKLLAKYEDHPTAD